MLADRITLNRLYDKYMLLNEIINEVGMTKRAVKYYEEKQKQALPIVDSIHNDNFFEKIWSKETKSWM